MTFSWSQACWKALNDSCGSACVSMDVWALSLVQRYASARASSTTLSFYVFLKSQMKVVLDSRHCKVDLQSLQATEVWLEQSSAFSMLVVVWHLRCLMEESPKQCRVVCKTAKGSEHVPAR